MEDRRAKEKKDRRTQDLGSMGIYIERAGYMGGHFGFHFPFSNLTSAFLWRTSVYGDEQKTHEETQLQRVGASEAWEEERRGGRS